MCAFSFHRTLFFLGGLGLSLADVCAEAECHEIQDHENLFLQLSAHEAMIGATNATEKAGVQASTSEVAPEVTVRQSALPQDNNITIRQLAMPQESNGTSSAAAGVRAGGETGKAGVRVFAKAAEGNASRSVLQAREVALVQSLVMASAVAAVSAGCCLEHTSVECRQAGKSAGGKQNGMDPLYPSTGICHADYKTGGQPGKLCALTQLEPADDRASFTYKQCFLDACVGSSDLQAIMVGVVNDTFANAANTYSLIPSAGFTMSVDCTASGGGASGTIGRRSDGEIGAISKSRAAGSTATIFATVAATLLLF